MAGRRLLAFFSQRRSLTVNSALNRKMSALRLQALNRSLFLSSRDIGIQLYPGRPNVQLVAETQSVGHYLGGRTRIGAYDTEAEVDRPVQV